MIPEDWEIKPLHTLADKIMVGIASAATHAYRKRGVVMFRNQNIKPGYLDDMDVLYIDEVYEETYRNKRLKAGDLLTARTGYPGTTSIVPVQYEGAQSFTTLITRPRQSLVGSEYLCCFINSEVGQTYFEQNQIGGGQKNVNAGALKHLAVPLPPTLAEQRAIAEALSDVDKLLGSLEKLIAKKRAIKQAAMQQLLTGKTRLPGFSGEWETTTLGEVANIKNGATPSTQISAYWNGSIPWCTPTDITATQGKYLLATERSVTEAGLASCAASLLPVGTLLLCSRATIGEIKIAVSPVCTNQGFKSLVCKDNVSNEFLYYLLLTLKPQMIERAIGSTFLEIGKRDVSSIKLCVPTYAEQRAIAAVLSDMDAEIAALERRRDKTRAIKQGMMQQLLTGRVRLVKPTRTTEASGC